MAAAPQMQRTFASLTEDEIAVACDYVKEHGLDAITADTVLVLLPALHRDALCQFLGGSEPWIPLRALQTILSLYKVTDYFVNHVGMQFVFVPTGTFWMSAHGQNAQRQVTIAEPFFLGTHLVTQGQWQAVMGNNPSHFSRTGKGADKVSDVSDTNLRDFPVESVSWDDVQKFLKRLNANRDDWRYRLPTEAEWEYACRGAASTKEECMFDYYFEEPTSTLLTHQANCWGSRPSPVGTYHANRLGLYDMHGNVWEWADSLLVAEGDTYRVICGGSWDNDSVKKRCADRSCEVPVTRFYSIGFRVTRVPAQSQ